MRSIKLDKDLEDRLKGAARLTGIPVPAIVRQAIEHRCDAILGQRLVDRLRDVAGVIRSDGGRARQTGSAFRV